MKTTKFRINVTKEIIEESKMCSYNTIPEIMYGTPHFIRNLNDNEGMNCAIAKAICNIFPNTLVGSEVIRFFNSLEDLYTYTSDYFNSIPYERVELPLNAIDFIMEFDDLDPLDRVQLEPISFEIDVPDSVIDKINIDEVKKLLKNSNTMELVN